MMHHRREWQVSDVESAEEIARLLHEHTWTLCTAFRYGGVLWLNDSTCEDAVQEYAVVREEDMVQVESITVNWCTLDKLREYAEQYADPAHHEVMYGKLEPTPSIAPPGTHGRCALCA